MDRLSLSPGFFCGELVCANFHHKTSSTNARLLIFKIWGLFWLPPNEDNTVTSEKSNLSERGTVTWINRPNNLLQQIWHNKPWCHQLRRLNMRWSSCDGIPTKFTGQVRRDYKVRPPSKRGNGVRGIQGWRKNAVDQRFSTWGSWAQGSTPTLPGGTPNHDLEFSMFILMFIRKGIMKILNTVEKKA